jgi:TusA-related sulfurtransferase
MKTQLIDALTANFSANILKYKMNVEVMLNNPLAIHDHTDWMSAVEKEIAHIAEYEDKLEILQKHFNTGNK